MDPQAWEGSWQMDASSNQVTQKLEIRRLLSGWVQWWKLGVANPNHRELFKGVLD